MTGKRFSLHWTKLAPFAGLLFLCLLWSLSSLRIDLLPSSAVQNLPVMEKQALPSGMLSVAASIFAIAKRRRPNRQQIRSAILIGLGLFVVPSFLVMSSSQGISELTRVALFSLAPVFTVVLEPHIAGTTGQQPRGALVAALLAVGGIFAIFPAQIPSSIVSAGAFLAVVLAAISIAEANCLGAKAAAESPISTLAAISSATAFLCFAVFGPLLQHEPWHVDALAPELAWSALVGLPGLLLLFWLMQRMSAARMSTRFVIAPLITALLGIAFFAPQVSFRDMLGFILIAAGAGWLLIAPDEHPDAASSSLNLNGPREN